MFKRIFGTLGIEVTGGAAMAWLTPEFLAANAPLLLALGAFFLILSASWDHLPKLNLGQKWLSFSDAAQIMYDEFADDPTVDFSAYVHQTALNSANPPLEIMWSYLATEIGKGTLRARGRKNLKSTTEDVLPSSSLTRDGVYDETLKSVDLVDEDLGTKWKSVEINRTSLTQYFKRLKASK